MARLGLRPSTVDGDWWRQLHCREKGPGRHGRVVYVWSGRSSAPGVIRLSGVESLGRQAAFSGEVLHGSPQPTRQCDDPVDLEPTLIPGTADGGLGNPGQFSHFRPSESTVSARTVDRREERRRVEPRQGHT